MSRIALHTSLAASVPLAAAALALLFAAITLRPSALRGQTSVPEQPNRTVNDNVLNSPALPATKVRVDDAFSYLGSFDFVLKGIAYGERHIFADTADAKVRRLFIFQFEGFLPNNEHTYNYDFTHAETIGGHKFRQNTWAYSNEKAAKNNPNGEGALTAAFLRSKELELEDELMMSRFLMVPDDARRHEMILFYLENASTTGYSISTFYDMNDNPTRHWKEISQELTARSRESFRILDE